jgi:adenylate cyclase
MKIVLLSGVRLKGAGGNMRNRSDNDWSALANLVSGSQNSGLSELYGLGTIPVGSTPSPPATTTASQIQKVEERFEKHLQRVRDALPITSGRVVPGDDDLPIGDARRLRLAVLFLDICGFSRIPSGEEVEQDQVFKALNLFMAEMLQVVRALEGDFEKNTGDGLMAYFKDGPEPQCAQRAVDAAVTMHCYNDQVISPRMKAIGLPELRFRVGIETGLVTIANVGVRGDHHSLVAIGDVPNVACRLMNLIPNGGIVLGHYTRQLLSADWQKETNQLGPVEGYVFRGTEKPYLAWEMKYRVPDSRWILALSGIRGGK